ncbi:dimethyladenosine transferase 2, mitochondrial [Onthophagus taurus]|uniref:dimethyladenosine transferase 2, mitochondrial n=1 Tax=Onthophagus taurus TaxID=166361 RepID=UPI0039BDD781
MFNKIKFKNNLIYGYKRLSEYRASSKGNVNSHTSNLTSYFNSASHLKTVQPLVPKDLLDRERNGFAKKLYLVDSELASIIAEHILPKIKKYENVVVCEANPGLGYLTKLLKRNVKRLKLYENHSELRKRLKENYSGRNFKNVEIFSKDLLHLWRMEHLDKYDKGKRIQEFFKGIHKKNWNENPSFVIIATMPQLDFINYLMKAIAIQSELIMHGRMELYVIIRPGDFLKLTSGPPLEFPAYQSSSVLYKTFCETKLLAELPRNAFFPWDSKIKINSRTKITTKYDLNKLYLVQIQLKENFGLQPEQCLPYYYFVKQLFGRGNVRIIPKLEQWISNVGYKLIVPDKNYKISQNMGVYTRTGELMPEDILNIFQIFYNHQGYSNSPFTAMVDAELLKHETVDTDLAEDNKLI